MPLSALTTAALAAWPEPVAEPALLAALAAPALALVYQARITAPPGPLRSLAKTGSVWALALAAHLGGAPAALVLALTLCGLGDLCLSRVGARAFALGVGWFAAGHLAYAALFLTRPESAPAQLAAGAAPGLALALVALGLAMARALAARAGPLKRPVIAYVPVILAMALAALSLPRSGALALALPAALAFLVSDMALAAERFLLAPGGRAARLAGALVWPLYWGAQAGFTLAFTPALWRALTQAA